MTTPVARSRPTSNACAPVGYRSGTTSGPASPRPRSMWRAESRQPLRQARRRRLDPRPIDGARLDGRGGAPGFCASLDLRCARSAGRGICGRRALEPRWRPLPDDQRDREKSLLRRARGLVFLTERIREELARAAAWPEKPTAVIPCAVDTGAFAAPDRRPHSRAGGARPGGGPGPRLLRQPGQLVPLREMLDFFDVAAGEIEGLCFLIVSPDEQKARASPRIIRARRPSASMRARPEQMPEYLARRTPDCASWATITPRRPRRPRSTASTWRRDWR